MAVHRSAVRDRTMTPAGTTAAASIRDGHARLLRRRARILAGLLLICLVGLMIDLASGPSATSVGDAFRALLMPDEVAASTRIIVRSVRLPVALLALLVGAALSLAGAEMQTILDNSLASPSTLGVSSAAALGAALAIVLDWGLPGVPSHVLVTGNAFMFALGSMLLLQLLASRTSRGSDDLVLLGIALVFTFEAAISLLQFVASADALQQLVFWSMGSLARADWTAVGALGLTLLVTIPFSFRAARKMTALRLGEERALSFGVDVRRLRRFSLLRVSLLAATAVSFVGTIAFVGLVGPHVARLLVGEDHRFFLPASALIGAAVVSFASIAAKTIVPGVLLPISIVTAFVGLPIFFLLILRRQSAR